MSFPIGNFDFPKVWWGAIPIGGGGGQLPPLAPMVTTALMLVVMHRHSALTYITSCTELLTYYLENQKRWYFHPSNVLALYSFYPPEPKCITQNKTQRSQINFAKEPNLAPELQSGQPCCRWYFCLHLSLQLYNFIQIQVHHDICGQDS